MRTKWYERFLQRISDLLPLGGSDSQLVALSKLNPDHIEVENVRSILDVSTSAAKRVCETAVRRGLFCVRIAVICPDDSVALVVNDRNSIPQTVRCWRQYEDGSAPEEVPTETLEQREFYVLNER